MMKPNRDGKLLILILALHVLLLIAIVIAASGCRSLPPLRPSPTRPLSIVDGPYRVHRVVDGDTVILDGVGPLRLTDVDAAAVGTPAGDAAKAELAARVDGKIVEIRFTRRKKPSGQGSAGTVVRDRYGRLLGTISPPEN